MRNRLFLLISTFICIIATSSVFAQGNSNNVFIGVNGINPSSINTCQGLDTFRFKMLNINAFVLTGVEMTYSLPAGVTYVSSFTNSAGTLTEIDVTDVNNPILGFSDLVSGENPTIEIVTRSNCDIVGQVNLANSIRIDVANNGSYDEVTPTTVSPVAPTYVPNNPSIITSSDVATINAQFGQSYSRTFTLEESGNGFLTEFLFERTYGDAYTVDSLLLITPGGEVNIPFTPIMGPGSTDTIRITLSNADLIAAGITDGTFDQSDQIQIREVVTVLNCDGNNAGQAVGYWACGGVVCEKVNPISVGILFGTFQPNLNIVLRSAEDELGILPPGHQFPLAYNCGASYEKAMLLQNVGNEYANRMRFSLYLIDPHLNYLDTAAGFFYQIGLNGPRVPVDSFILTNSWNSSSEVAPVFTGGAVPRRVDIYVSEPLAAGDSIFLIHSEINVPNDQSTGLYGCTTGGIGYVISRARIDGMQYTDACGTGTIVEGSQGDDNYNYNRFAVGRGTSPTIVFDGAPGTTEFISNSAVLDGWSSIANSLGAMDSTGYIDFKFTLPDGLDYAGDPLNPADGNFELIGSDGVTLWIPDTLLVTDSSFIARYYIANNPKPSTFDFTTNTSLNFSYVADCSELVQPPCPGEQNNPSVTIQKEFYVVPSTSCASKFYLDCIQMTDPIQVYCSACPCPLGVQYHDANIFRKSLGNPDNDQNGIVDTLANGDVLSKDSLNFPELKLLNFIEGDTLRGYYEAIVNTTSIYPANDTVPVMPYMYGFIQVTDIADFVGLTAIATVYDASTGTEHISTIPLPTFNEGSNRWVVDLSGDVLIASGGMTPPLPAGFVYEHLDSVRFDMDLRGLVNVGDVVQSTDFSLQIFGSDSIYPSNVPTNRRFVCIPPGLDERRLSQYGWREDKAGQNTVLVAGCDPIILFNFAHNVAWTDGWVNPFPYEHRRLFSVPEMRFNLPEGFSIVGDSMEFYYYRNNPLGSNISNTLYAPYEIFAGGDSVRIYDIERVLEHSPYGDIRSTGSMQLNVRPKFQASCEVADNSYHRILTNPYIGYNDEQFEGLRDTLAVSTRETTGTYNIDYSSPQINAIAASPIVNAITRVAKWTVNFQNLAATGNNAYNTWFYFDNALSGGQMTVDSIVDIATDSVYTSTVTSFFQLGELPGATTRQFEIFASYRNCDLECIEWVYGYNCPGYFDDFNDGVLKLPSCSSVDTLCVQPNEALWQAAVVVGLDSSDLCVKNDVVFQFTNVQTGHSYNSTVKIDMPLNSFVDVDSIYLEYPVGGDTYLVPPNAVEFSAPSEYYVYLDSIVDSLGLVGLAGPLTSGENNFRLQYTVEFGCDYISGSGINTSVYGLNSCGSATNEAGAPSQEVYVYGVPEPYFINPRVSSNDSLAICNTDLTVRLNMLKLGSNPIGTNDSIRLTLPLGVSYVHNSMTFLHNPLPHVNPDIDTIGNLVINTWLMPTGVAELDSIDFTVDLAVETEVDCGFPGILVQTFVDNTAFCATLGANCGVKAQTGSRAFNLNIIRPTIAVDNSGAAVLYAGAVNVYQLDAYFANTDSVNDIPDGLTYDVYCADNLGLATGPSIFQGSIGPIAAGDSVLISEEFSSSTACTVAEGLAIVFERSPSNCLCDAAFLVPLEALEAIVAVDDADTTEPALPITITVLANDSSKTSTFDTTSVATIDPALNGSTTVNTDGTITYTPDATFSGLDSFTYVICAQEISVNCDTATVTIFVPNTTEAKDDINSTLQDVPVSGSVTTNDSDPQGHMQLVNPTPLSGPSNGSVVLNPNGNYTYTPDPGFTGVDVFEYEICDNGTPVACDTATVYITVIGTPNGENNPPIAVQDVTITEVDVPVNMDLTSNDSEIDGDSIIVNTTPVSGPSNGTVVINSDGTAVYTPDSGFVGVDTFIYSICDPYGLCDTTEGIITIVPDVANVVYANDDAGSGMQDNPISGSMIANDFDPEGDVYFVNSLTPVTNVSNGSVVLHNDGTYTYTPSAGYVGPDQFTYELCDNGTPQACDIATVYLTVLPLPNTTTASNDINATPQDIPVAGNVLTNDTDLEGDNQSVNPTPLSPTTNGTVSLYPNGSYVYTPDPGFTGVDEFTYEVCDDGTPVACDTATVFITVIGNPIAGNNPPVAIEDEATTEVDVPVDGNLLGNDYEPDGDPITINTTPYTGPSNGGVVINTDGTFTYTPDPGFVGVDTFEYIICDPYGLCDTTMAIITIVEDLGNVTYTQDDAGTGLQDQIITGNISDNDSDPEGDTQSLNTTPLTNPLNGTVSILPNGDYVYTPDPGFVGNDQFIYSACDNGTPVACDTSTVYLTVIPPAAIPIVAVNDTTTTMVDVPVNINVIANDTASAGFDNTSLDEVTPPMHGSIFVNTDGTIDYTPDPGFIGVDSFVYVICDVIPTCDTATVYVTITAGPNTPPNAVNDDTTTLENTPVVIDPLTNDTDLEGPLDSTSVTIITTPNNSTVTVDPVTGEMTVTPEPNFTGVITYQYEVCDTGMPVYCDIATVTVTIIPTADTVYVTVPEDSTVMICTDTSVNFEDPITGISICGEPENGTITPSFIPCLDYTPDENYVGPDTICVVTCAGVYCDTTIVVIDVTPVNDPPVAEDTTVTVPEDSMIVICPVFTDIDGVDTSITVLSCGPSNGSATIMPGDMCVEYTPEPNFSGVDEICYVVCDADGLCDTAIITIIVPPVVDTIYTTVPEDSMVTICTDTSVNFEDPITAIYICDPADHGDTDPDVLPCVDYTPAPGYVGPDTMCVITCSGVYCDTTIVIIEVTPVNDPPVAEDTTVTIPEDSMIVICPVFTDIDGLDTSITVLNCGPSNGSATITPGNYCVEYTPEPNFSGVDEICYVVCDADGLCDTAVITIIVTPVADTIYTTVPEDSMVTICTDTSVNFEDPITSISICDAPDHGAIDPSFVPCVDYTPATNYVGPDTMCVITCSGVYCDTTIVIIDVTPVNDPPVAEDTTVTIPEDSTIVICPVFTDMDGTDTTITVLTCGPSNGTAAITPDTYCVEYTPAPNYVGVDEICYVVCDADGLCDTAVITIIVTPVADTIYTTVPEDSTVTICTDTSVNFANPITSISLCEAPENGTITPSLLPCVDYTPMTDYVGPDTMCVITCSGVYCDTTIVIIDVTPVNDPPVAVDDDTTTTEDTPVVIDVVTNDYDIDGPIDSSSITITVQPENGTVVVNGDGTVTYIPDANYCGLDEFTYSVCDTGLPVYCDEAVVTIDIICAPDTSEITLPEDSFYVFCTDSVTNLADPITNISLCGSPTYGTLTQDFLPCVTYTPFPDYNGPDTTCLITCAGNVCDTTYIFITVTPVIDVPVLAAIADICETESAPALTGVVEAGAVIQWIQNGVIIGTGSPFIPTVVTGVNCFQAVGFNAALGLTSPDTAEVCFTVDSLPTNVYAGPDDTICGFQDYELQATADGLLVYWTQIQGQQVSLDHSNPNAIAALEPNNAPGTNNVYTFAWTAQNGLCSVSDTVSIWVTNPHYTDAGNDTSVCIPEAGGSIQLDATLTPGATGWWVYAGTGDVTFADSTDANTIVDGVVPYVNTSSTYMFFWFEQIGECVAKDVVIWTINESPGLDVAAADTFCLGSDYVLDANITGFSQASYSWRLNGPTGTILSWDEDAIVSPTVNTTYYVVATVAFGQNFCTTIDSLDLIVDGAPIAVNDGCYDLFEDSVLVGSTNDWLANDDISAVLGGEVGFVVLDGSQLDPASTIEIDNVTATYTYTPYTNMNGVDSAIIGIYNANCPDLMDTFVVCFNVQSVTDAPIMAVNDTVYVLAESITDISILDNDFLDDNAIDTVVTILTQPLYGSVDTPVVDGIVTYTSETEWASVDSFEYLVCQELVDGEMLCDTAWVYVIVDGELYIPEGFTPNGDGVNDNFEIPNLSILYPEATLQIFNRWGDEVWNSKGPYGNDWNGVNFSGDQLPDGTYFYIVKLNNGSDRSMASFVVIFR